MTNLLFIAWKFLLYDKAKSIGALAGVVISTFLIGQQVGVFNFINDGITKLITISPGYVWVVDNQTENINSLQRLDTRVQFEMASLPGVEKVHPVFIGGGNVQAPTGERSGISLIGVQAPEFVGAPTGFLEGSHEDLLPDGAVSVDIYDTRVFPENQIGTSFEINDRKAYVGARLQGVRGFGRVFVFTTIERARAYNNAGSNVASVFLVKPAPGVSQATVAKTINDNIFGVRAWEEKAFFRSTVIYYLKHSSIVTAIGSMVLFAFVSGYFIVGLTLYSAAIDRMRDYGTMKAIGATNGYVRRLLYTQAMILAVPGFAIGEGLVQWFKWAIESQGLLIRFTPAFNVIFFLLICSISLGGAAFASRRIIRLEPAAVFRF
jgi:putative ABC transport system permease protein